MEQQKTTLLDLIRESVIVQGLLALMALGGTFWLLLAGQPVDDRIWMIDTAVLGFFFGAKGVFTVRGASEMSVRHMAGIARQNQEMMGLVLSQLPVPAASASRTQGSKLGLAPVERPRERSSRQGGELQMELPVVDRIPIRREP